VPILTGPVNEEMASKYGKVFAPYFDDEHTLFIFSTDFCHWGTQHQYTYYNEAHGQIWQSIEQLDGEGMNHIQNHDFKSFQSYINLYENTICGRHVLYIFLKIVEASKLRVKTKFVKYSQSEQVKKHEQSSVSYASGITFVPQ
jgi:MEMO1 family protein